MKLNDFVSITELSRLTGRTRPTLYKYIKDYSEGNYDEIPYSFLMLIRLGEEEETTRRDILEYCEKHYSQGEKDKGEREPGLEKIIELITQNKDKLDFDRLTEIIEKELKK